MAIENIKRKVNRIDVSILGASVTSGYGSFSATENIEGIIKKIALVSGTMTSGNMSITDTLTAENIWVEDSIDTSTSNTIKYPRVSGHTTAGAAIDDQAADEIGFPTSGVTISVTGISGGAATATCYIYFQ